MKKTVMVVGVLGLVACAILYFEHSNNVENSANKPENIQQLLENFTPGDEVVAYADSTLVP